MTGVDNSDVLKCKRVIYEQFEPFLTLEVVFCPAVRIVICVNVENKRRSVALIPEIERVFHDLKEIIRGGLVEVPHVVVHGKHLALIHVEIEGRCFAGKFLPDFTLGHNRG